MNLWCSKRRSLGTLVAALAAVALAGPACGGSGGAASDPAGDGAGSWSFTDDRGETISLDAPPTNLAADAASAGGLWEYGIDIPAGVFGDVTLPNGEAGPAIGLADPDDFTSVSDAGQINLEQLASLRPDVIVAAMWTEDSFYGIGEDQIDEVEQIAPVIGIRVDERPVTEPLARIAELAESIDPDAAGRVADAKADFDEASAAFRAAAEGNEGLVVVAASGSPSEMYVAYPPAWPDLSYYQELGLDLVVPEDNSTANGFWETLSWEEAGKYPADLLLADARGGDLDEVAEIIPATALSLPAVEAEQVALWPAVHAYGYGNFAQILDDLAAAVAVADPDVSS